MRGESYCYVHHPNTRERRQAASRRGGRTGGRGRGKGDVKDVKAWLLKLAADVQDEKLEAKSGAVIAQILNVFLRGVELERKIKETDELEARLEALEDREGGTRWGA
jgi:hypothetical protein